MIRALRLLLLVGTPLTLAVVLWFHPGGGENIFEDVREDVDAWLVVHTVFLLFTPLLALAAYVLLRGLTGAAVTVSRVSLIFLHPQSGSNGSTSRRSTHAPRALLGFEIRCP